MDLFFQIIELRITMKRIKKAARFFKRAADYN